MSIPIEKIYFKDLSIGAFFCPEIHGPSDVLWQKTTDVLALKYVYDKSKSEKYRTDEGPLFPDEVIFDTSDPVDRRGIILHQGDDVVVPVYQGISIGIVDKIFPPTNSGIKRAINHWIRFEENNYIKDKAQYFWKYDWAKALRMRVKTLLDGASKPRQFRASSMYRARLDLY